MVSRPLWQDRVAAAHRQASVVWLTGVRRVGKTTLARAVGGVYLDCDLPSVAERLHDPERFLDSVDARVLVLDEVHQLPDPSRLLKIAADHYPKLRVIATGSSTLAATQKFRDSLTGRKRTVHLLPVLAEELAAFGIRDLDRRLLHGGLPSALLAPAPPSEFYAEWMDSFYARDVQELFRVEKRAGFLKLLETLLRQSGGLLEATSLSRAVSLSRPTVVNYLEVLQVTHAVTLLRPFHAGGGQELTHQPKAYGFDTGFVAWAKGWNELHSEDRGLLWEHLVLETLTSLPGDRRIHYWRDKQQREVDFVIPTGRGACDAFECKWNPRSFDPRSLKALRANHPRGRNFLVAPIAGPAHERDIGGLRMTVVHPAELRTLG